MLRNYMGVKRPGWWQKENCDHDYFWITASNHDIEVYPRLNVRHVRDLVSQLKSGVYVLHLPIGVNECNGDYRSTMSWWR